MTIKYRRSFSLAILLYAFNPIFPSWLNSVYLFFIIPLFFVISLFQYPRYIKDNEVFRYYFYYFLFSLLTIAWATDPSYSINQLRFYVGGFLIVYVLSSFSTNEKYLKTLHVFYFLYLASCLILGFTQFGFATTDFGSERAHGEGLNANRFGYFVFIITFFLYYLGDIHPQKKIWKYLFFLVIPLTFYISLITASRQILIIQVPYIAFLLLHRYSRNIGLGSIIFVFALSLLTIVLSNWVMSIYESSLLAERMAGAVEEDARWELFFLGFKIGNEHFFTGVGFSNFLLYSNGSLSHSTFSEAYAEGGIIQLLLFVMVLFSYCKKQIKRYRITKDNVFIVLFVTGLFYAVFNLFYIFPYFALIMAFIFIIESESLHRYNEITTQIDNQQRNN